MRSAPTTTSVVPMAPPRTVAAPSGAALRTSRSAALDESQDPDGVGVDGPVVRHRRPVDEHRRLLRREADRGEDVGVGRPWVQVEVVDVPPDDLACHAHTRFRGSVKLRVPLAAGRGGRLDVREPAAALADHVEQLPDRHRDDAGAEQEDRGPDEEAEVRDQSEQGDDEDTDEQREVPVVP